MRCFYCGKEINKDSSDLEKSSLWHLKCMKQFFDTTYFPEIELNEKTLQNIADTNVKKGLTVTGYQKKISLGFANKQNKKLTILDYPTGFIIKPQVKEFSCMPESEYLVMQMAKHTGIRTVPFSLIKSKSNYVYITKRIDRDKNHMLAMEDFCQLNGRLTEDKYKGSYEQCAKIITRYSSRVGLDLSELYLRLVFCFVVGNSDMHLKNFSLIEEKENSNSYVLSDAYDLLPVQILLTSDIEDTALTLNGKKRNLTKNDFLKFAENIGLSFLAAKKIINLVVSLEEEYISMIENSYLSNKLKKSFKNILISRIKILNQ